MSISANHEHVNTSSSNQQLYGQIRLPQPPIIHGQPLGNEHLLGGLHQHHHPLPPHQQGPPQFANYLHSPLLRAAPNMQVPGAVNDIQNVANSAPQDLASIQQYVMLMNQQQQQQQHAAAAAAALQNQASGVPNSFPTNALLFNALNRSNDPNFTLSG